MGKNNKEWYMVTCVSGKEAQIIENIKRKIESESLQSSFDEVKVFQESTITNNELLKKSQGKEYKVKKVNMYKGHIFVKVLMSDEIWFLIRNTEYVTGLIGSSGRGAKPTPVSERQMRKSFDAEAKKEKEFAKMEFKNPFEKGTIVKVVYGSFEGDKGIVIESDVKKKIAIVEMEVFGKKIPTEFPFRALKIESEIK